MAPAKRERRVSSSSEDERRRKSRLSDKKARKPEGSKSKDQNVSKLIGSTLNMLVIKTAFLSKKVMERVKSARSMFIEMEVGNPGFALRVLQDSRFDELIGACIRELASSKRPVGPVGQNLQELRRLIDQQKAKEPAGDQKPVLPPQDRKPVPPPQDRKPVLPMPDQKPIPPQPDRKPIDVKPRMPAASPGQPPQPEKAKKKRPNNLDVDVVRTLRLMLGVRDQLRGCLQPVEHLVNQWLQRALIYGNEAALRDHSFVDFVFWINDNISCFYREDKHYALGYCLQSLEPLVRRFQAEGKVPYWMQPPPQPQGEGFRFMPPLAAFFAPPPPAAAMGGPVQAGACAYPAAIRTGPTFGHFSGLRAGGGNSIEPAAAAVANVKPPTANINDEVLDEVPETLSKERIINLFEHGERLSHGLRRMLHKYLNLHPEVVDTDVGSKWLIWQLQFGPI